MAKIYVASSWRNPWQPGVVKILRRFGHEVYDFREPTPGERGFAWSDIDEEWQDWKPDVYRKALEHPIAEHGFGRDMTALRECDACIMVMPCGNSANLELGFACGAGKKTAALFPHGVPITPIGGHTCWLPGKLHRIEPELMTKAADVILINGGELTEWAAALTSAGAETQDAGSGSVAGSSR